MACIYCNQNADTMDHIVPISYLSNRKTGRHSIGETIECCQECNSLLSNQLFDSIAERAMHINKRLKARYSRLINSQEWAQYELKQMGPEMQQYIRETMKKKEIILSRIYHSKIVAGTKNYQQSLFP